MPARKNVLSPGDISKLSGQVAGLATELSGRLKEIIEIQNSLAIFNPYAKAQLQKLEEKTVESSVKKQFNELYSDFKRQINNPLEKTSKKTSDLIERFQEKLQPRIAKLPYADDLQFPQLCAQIELTKQDFIKIQNEITPQVKALEEHFIRFANMLLLPAEADLQVRRMEKLADKLANDITNITTKLADLKEGETGKTLSLAQLHEKLELLTLQSQSLKTSRQSPGM